MVENEHFYKNYCDSFFLTHTHLWFKRQVSFIPITRKGSRSWWGFLCGAAMYLGTASVLPHPSRMSAQQMPMECRGQSAFFQVEGRYFLTRIIKTVSPWGGRSWAGLLAAALYELGITWVFHCNTDLPHVKCAAAPPPAESLWAEGQEKRCEPKAPSVRCVLGKRPLSIILPWIWPASFKCTGLLSFREGRRSDLSSSWHERTEKRLCSLHVVLVRNHGTKSGKRFIQSLSC